MQVATKGVTLSFSHIVIPVHCRPFAISHCRPFALSSSRTPVPRVILSHFHSVLSDSQILVLLHSGSFVVLSNSHPLVVLSDSCPLRFLSSQILVTRLVVSLFSSSSCNVLSHSRPLVILSDFRPLALSSSYSSRRSVPLSFSCIVVLLERSLRFSDSRPLALRSLSTSHTAVTCVATGIFHSLLF